VRDALFEAATAALASDSRASLARMRANPAGRLLPIEYSVVDRTDEEWSRLGTALLEEHDAAKRRDAPDARVVSYLEGVRADRAVAYARRNLSQSLDVVKRAWKRAVAKT
jgi:hypothetical protein